MHVSLKPLQESLGYSFLKRELLVEALTHPSFKAEHKDILADNQRLEFLGDAVVQVLISTYLYEKFETPKEGWLTKVRATLTNQGSLAEFARHIKLDEYIRLGKGEILQNAASRPSTMCDAFEALIGAIYLDSGHKLEIVYDLVISLVEQLKPDLQQLLAKSNPKGQLQEVVQKKISLKPEYETISAIGPDHSKTFTVEVSIDGKVYAQAKANQVKKAEQLAASLALKKLLEDD
ncbi:MAG: ribonuclease III [Lentisphaeria bacterium]|nr:ribonuclease III [Lentisphaeria bacterium]